MTRLTLYCFLTATQPISNVMFAFALLAMTAYLLSLGLIIPSLVRNHRPYRRLALLLACIALISHAIALQQRIFDVSTGQNLSLLNMGAMVSLIICLVMTFVASRNHGWVLLPIVYSFALINIGLASFIPIESITHLEATPSLLIHIGLALFSYATLIIAALYALQLAWLDYLLKNKKLTFTIDMPPLMRLERKMFHITQVGVVLLTLTLCTGLLYMEDLFSEENIHKVILSTLAWLIYLLLLWGHFRYGWRGRRVVWLSLAGAGLLTFAYFGSRLCQEIM